MRPIDADKLEAKCKEIIAQEREYGTTTTSWAHAYESFLDLLETTPTIDTQRWIPVTERLPELIPREKAGTAYSEAVIVWTTGKKAMIAVWDGIDFLCAADYWEAWGETITHWMPPPEGPKEDE